MAGLAPLGSRRFWILLEEKRKKCACLLTCSQSHLHVLLPFFPVNKFDSLTLIIIKRNPPPHLHLNTPSKYINVQILICKGMCTDVHTLMHDKYVSYKGLIC